MKLKEAFITVTLIFMFIAAYHGININSNQPEVTPTPSIETEIPSVVEKPKHTERPEDNDIPPAIEAIPTPIEEIKVVEPEYITYVVKPDDSFWRIADKFYGDGTLYEKIAISNGLTAKSIIHPGDELKIYDAQYIPEEKSPVVTKVTETEKELAVSYEGMTYAGNFRITGYDPYCVHCCGKADGITRSGRVAEINYSVGCNGLPLGTKIYIDGYGYYRVDDTGAGGTDYIDIACASHEACYAITNLSGVDVYIVE